MQSIQVKKEGSKAAFILCLIGAIITILFAVAFFVIFITGVMDRARTIGMPGMFGGDPGFKGAGHFTDIVGFRWIWGPLALGILIFIFSFKLRKNESLKKFSIVIMILSILLLVVSFNILEAILPIVGSIIGLVKSRKIN